MNAMGSKRFVEARKHALFGFCVICCQQKRKLIKRFQFKTEYAAKVAGACVFALHFRNLRALAIAHEFPCLIYLIRLISEQSEGLFEIGFAQAERDETKGIAPNREPERLVGKLGVLIN